jgi:hypothetical protein
MEPAFQHDQETILFIRPFTLKRRAGTGKGHHVPGKPCMHWVIYHENKMDKTDYFLMNPCTSW